ncbi:hypothetical protein QC761_0095940 [Podospora bellae-mahoneyi]|uniref:Uncharacterized protein n=1 Tax=Podospora bellae-mahoneyi TaxID=2093777 RepID=A0ABR0FA14_9PEZI|nr:hypothetical protein QC761_0095940 [Podospora bellae-mahoneyi]
MLIIGFDRSSQRSSRAMGRWSLFRIGYQYPNQSTCLPYEGPKSYVAGDKRLFSNYQTQSM